MKKNIGLSIFLSLAVFSWVFFLQLADVSAAATDPCIAQNGDCYATCPSDKESIPASDCGTMKCCRTTGAPEVPPGTDTSKANDCIALNGACYAGSCPSGKEKVSSNAKECVSSSNEQMLCCRSVGASSTPPNGSETTFQNPIAFDSVSEVVGALLNNLKGILAAIAIVFIVVGGLMYMLSAGDEKMITKAKSTITAAIIGLAIALAAPTFLKEVKNILGGAGGANPDAMVDQALTLKEIAMRTLDLLLSIVGIVAIIGLIVGGAFYLTAYGDEDRIKKGKSIITASIIGIAVALAALVIVKQVANLLGVQ